jgi:hypothetical protein
MAATIIEEAVRDIIRTNGGVSAITTRCFPVKVPQNPTFPFILYQKVTATRHQDLSGGSGLTQARFQIEAWAETYSRAKELANAIRDALDGYTGTSGTVKVWSILILSEFDMYEETIDCLRVIMDFSVWHTEL